MGTETGMDESWSTGSWTTSDGPAALSESTAEEEAFLATTNLQKFEQSLSIIPWTPQLHLQDPYNLAPSIGYADLHEAAQWFNVSKLDSRSSGTWVSVASNSWGNTVWKSASGTESSFAALLLFIAHKKSVLTGRAKPELYTMVNHVIQRIQKGIRDPSSMPASGTALAVCGMALVALRDREFANAKMHMEALRVLVQLEYLEDEAWNFCAWVDLLVATAFRWSPFLPYRPAVPGFSMGLAPAAPMIRSQEARKMALKVSRLVPLNASTGIDEHQAFYLLTAMNEACFAAENRTSAPVAPWLLLYDLAFRLCTHLGNVKMCGSSQNVELLLTSLQLGFWSAARYWIPQSVHNRQALTSRMFELLAESSDPVQAWQEQASLQSLLWITVLGLMSAARFDSEVCAAFLVVIKRIFQQLKVTRSQDLRRLLLPFPGVQVQAEKEESIRVVWRELKADRPSQWIEAEELSHKKVTEAQSRRFLSIFQFDTGP
ncbi:hypothetical protein Slin15195_G061820 [Septoria linicola]|uniref:Transcription factor domain-containing protein n=1 Tax=Septoria linicola TaxID=215465 RepID=A0A9Q9EKY8_9PEZI|nr:hypothetical protein Slin15195_G061820 [Septoria linicola]